MTTIAPPLLIEPVDSMHAESLAALREVRGDAALLRTIAASWTPRPYPGPVAR